MEEALLQFITETVARNKKAGKEPSHCVYRDVREEVSRALNSLYRQGLIESGNTLNDKWIRPRNG
jgi:hypothetical protein